MTVYERVQALGEWELQLSEGTPKTVRDLIAPFSHVVVLPGRVYANRLADDAILAGSLYTGVVLRLPGREMKIGGAGLAWWLGDSDNKGAILRTAVTGNGASLATWVTALLPVALDAGTVTSPGGSMTGAYQWVTRRQALDAVCNYFGVEWRVNPDLTLDVATAATLYGSTPTAITLAAGGGNDVDLQGLEAVVAVEQDYFDHATEVVVQGPGGRGSAGGASGTYRDGTGNLIRLTRVVDSPDCPPGQEATVATNLLNLWSGSAGQREITVNANRYAITGVLRAGASLYVYDPEFGLVDTSNLVRHQGRATFPISVRVLGARWPVEEGMSVLVRYYSGGFKYLDITEYVETETGGAQLEVAWNMRSLGGEFQASSPSTEQFQTGAWATYTPTWTSTGSAPTLSNGTLVGGFRREGTTLHLRGQLQVGSTSTVGTGELRFPLPSGLTSSSAQYQTMSGFWYDGSATDVNRAIVVIDPGVTYMTFQVQDTVDTRMATSSLATGDIVTWTGTIEIAP